MLLADLLPEAYSACFLIVPRPTRDGTTNLEYGPQACPEANLVGILFSFGVPCSKMTLACVNLTQNKHKDKL